MRKPDGLVAKLDALLYSDAHSAGAARFAEKYAGHNPEEQARQAVERLLELIVSGEHS